MNRGVEIDPSVADGPRSVILEQVSRGVAIRMAVLYLLGGGSARNGASLDGLQAQPFFEERVSCLTFFCAAAGTRSRARVRRQADLLIKDGKIAKIERGLSQQAPRSST